MKVDPSLNELEALAAEHDGIVAIRLDTDLLFDEDKFSGEAVFVGLRFEDDMNAVLIRVEDAEDVRVYLCRLKDIKTLVERNR